MQNAFYLISIQVLIWFCALVSGTQAAAQDRFRVERIKAVPDNLPILNIHVDENNIKWIANSRTLYKLEAKDQAIEVPISGGEASLLQFPGGNADIRWNKDAMQGLIGSAEITTAAYDRSQKILWIGTNGYGVFKFQANPGLKLIEQLHIDNSKLRSDFINSIYVAQSGKVWIATEDGAAVVDGNQWSLEQKFFNILRIRGRGNETWAIGDDLIWLIDRKENWNPIAINRREIEGQIHDIALDKDGRVWIASNIMTAYRVDTDRYQRFGPGQYFTSQFVNYVAEDDDATLWVGTDDKGVYIIEKESTITVTSEIEKYLDCNNPGSDAIVSVRAIGGKPPYEFQWQNGSFGDRLSGLGPGQYQLTVTDMDGSTKEEAIEIPDPKITVAAKMDRAESGIGMEDGAASVTITGGVPPYTYEWFGGLGEATMTGLAEGEYGITITDAAGCTAITTVQITQVVQPLTLTTEQVQFIRCPGDASAIAVARPTGGKPPFSYRWSHGLDSLEYGDALAAGLYTVTVTDAEGTTATASIEIAEPAPLVSTIQIISPATANADNGVAQVESSGGNPPYQYLWDNGENTSEARLLSARRHVVTITDDSGCTTEAAVDISENILPLSVTINQTGEIRCAGDSTVSLALDVSGGKSPFTYQWNETGGTADQLPNIGPGDYSVTVTDAAGGTISSTISIKGPKPIEVTTQAEAPALSGTNEGHAVARADGGTGKLSYAWDNGDTGQRTVSLSAGIHQVTITDQAGCSVIAEVEILENILPLNAVIEQTGSINCAGESTASLNVTPAGGKAPYSYFWSNGSESVNSLTGLSAGTYSVTVTDSEGMSTVLSTVIDQPDGIAISITADAPTLSGESNGEATVKATGGTGRLIYSWDTGSDKVKATGLSPGIHVVTVTDENGCAVTSEVTISEDFLPLAVTLAQEGQILCNNDATGILVATTTGGKAPYTLDWSNGIEPGNTKPTGLKAGTYQLTVTDANGNSIEKDISLGQPDALQLTVIPVASATANNSDGKAKVEITGGVMPYTYAWSHGETTAEASTLPAGQHVVTVTDRNNCTITGEVNITEDVLELKVTLNQTARIPCAGQTGAQIEAQISGGKSPFEYSWSDAASGSTRRGLGAGTYTVEVSDAAGQKVSASINIEEPAPLSGEMLDVRAATHERIQDGRATAKITGGMTPYSFTWDNGESSARASTLSVGDHTVTVTDAMGCTISLRATINEKILPELTAANLESGEAVRMEKLQFEADSSAINSESIPTLEELYQFLYDNPTIVVEIGGHTNGLPEHEYCDRLSTARAKAVADYIIAKGVDEKRILFKGYGKRQPIATNMTPDGRRRNQRVEVKIVKLSE